MPVEEQGLTAEQNALRDKMVHWYDVAAELVLNNHTCEQGWRDFTPSSAKGCGDYHAVFPLLDLMGMVSSPWAHSQFYEGALWAATHERSGGGEGISFRFSHTVDGPNCFRRDWRRR